MNNKFTYLICICFTLFTRAQQQNLYLEKGNCTKFKSNIFTYGFKSGSFVVYKLNLDLNILDSSIYSIEKTKVTDYLSIDCDTLHGTLNFYLQKKDKLKATLLRYDSQFKLINEFKNIEITKLNPLANYDQQKFVYKNFCYVVKTASDTTGKQYYLSKFELMKSAEKPFDYKFKWQFNFEKKYIRNVNIFYADTNFVLAYVNIHAGERKGQWLLKINASNGLLIKGKKISSSQNLNYRYSNYCIDTVSKDVFILGQLTTVQQLAGATPTLFILQFDSLLTLTNQKLIPQKIFPANSKTKVSANYIFQITKVNAKPHSLYDYQLDLFKNYGTEYNYCNSFMQNFSVEDNEIVNNLDPIKEYPEIENYYFTSDKKDLNGKLFQDSTISSDRLFYKIPVFTVKIGFKLNEDLMPVWLMKKNDIKTNSVNYSILKPGKKVYELTPINTISKDENPNFILINNESYLISSTKNNSVLHLELGNW